MHHSGVEIWMIAHQDIGIPSCRDEQCVHPTSYRSHEYLAYLQPDEERKSHHYGGECAAVVVSGLGELKVEIGEEGAEVCDKCCTLGIGIRFYTL